MSKRRSANRGFYWTMFGMNLMVGVMVATFVVSPPRPVAAEPIKTRQSVTSRPVVEPVPAVVGQPVYLEVADVGVSLPVIVGTYDETAGDWTLSDVSALHADSSMPINDSNGVTLIYAHALPGLFASLSRLGPDMIASVRTDNSRTFRYKFRSSVEVLPTDTSVFNADGPPTLVLQTCSGAWDTHRTLYYFDFMDQQQI